MNEHPVIACYRGLDSADAVQFGALMAASLRQPLVLAHAYRYEPAALSARALASPDNARRATAAQAALRRARRFARSDVEVRDRIVASADVGAALTALAREISASLLVLGRDTEGHVTRSLIPRTNCPVAVAPLSAPLPAIPGLRRIGVAYDGIAVVARRPDRGTPARAVDRRATRGARGRTDRRARADVAAHRAAVAWSPAAIRDTDARR